MTTQRPLLRLAAVGGAAALVIAGTTGVSHARPGSAEPAADLALDVDLALGSDVAGSLAPGSLAPDPVDPGSLGPDPVGPGPLPPIGSFEGSAEDSLGPGSSAPRSPAPSALPGSPEGTSEPGSSMPGPVESGSLEPGWAVGVNAVIVRTGSLGDYEVALPAGVALPPLPFIR